LFGNTPRTFGPNYCKAHQHQNCSRYIYYGVRFATLFFSHRVLVARLQIVSRKLIHVSKQCAKLHICVSYRKCDAVIKLSCVSYAYSRMPTVLCCGTNTNFASVQLRIHANQLNPFYIKNHPPHKQKKSYGSFFIDDFKDLLVYCTVQCTLVWTHSMM
jgi:hypothetical protein